MAMSVESVFKFVGKRRASKLQELDVYVVTHYCNRPIFCIDAMSLDEWTDGDGSHTFVYEGYDVTNREMMVSFREWLDELTTGA